jgi:hypothetical protein
MMFFVGDNAKRERAFVTGGLGKVCKSLPLPARERVGVRCRAFANRRLPASEH